MQTFFFMYKLFMLQIINKQFNTFSSLLHMIWLYKPFTLILVSKSQRTAHLSHVINMFLSILFYKSNKKKSVLFLWMNWHILSFHSHQSDVTDHLSLSQMTSQYVSLLTHVFNLNNTHHWFPVLDTVYPVFFVVT